MIYTGGFGTPRRLTAWNASSISIGIGKMMVELFSAEISAIV